MQVLEAFHVAQAGKAGPRREPRAQRFQRSGDRVLHGLTAQTVNHKVEVFEGEGFVDAGNLDERAKDERGVEQDDE